MAFFLAYLSLALGCVGESILPSGDSVTAPIVGVTPPDTSSNSLVGEPELPRVLLDTRLAATPSTGRTLRVASNGDLQAALDSAKFGDQILLAAGATFTGNFVLPAKTDGISGNWITIRSDGQLPPEGSRMTPAQAAALSLPKIQSGTLLPTLRTAPSASRWRIIGIEVTASSATTTSQGLVWAGDGSSAQSTSSSVPSDLIYDRVYVHGGPGLDVRRCIALNSARTAIIDSYLSDCHAGGLDAQAVAGWNGPGPFKIVDNYLEASTENIAFGGADPAIANLVPADIEIRRNHLVKPLAWKGVWLAKNLIELKVGHRVLIEANVMENSWPDGQAGFAMVLWSVNQGGGCPNCGTADVTVRENLIRNVACGFQLTATWDTPAVPMQRVAIRDNVLVGINTAGSDGYGRIFAMGKVIPNLIIEHNTAFSPNNASLIWDGSTSTPLPGLIVRNNLLGGGAFSAYGAGQAAWDRYAGPGSEFAGNVSVAASGILPTSNSYAASSDFIGLAGGQSAAYSASASLADLALTLVSPYKNKATDGRDPGADTGTLATVLQGVVVP